MPEREFVDAALAELRDDEGGEELEVWQKAAPLWQSYQGLVRHWEKKRQSAATG